MNNLLKSMKEFLVDRFNLKDDQADESVIIDSIRKNIEFKDLWALIFAIFIAAVLKELRILYPDIQNFGVGKMIIQHVNKSVADTVEIAIAGFKSKFGLKETRKLQSLLRLRYQSDKLKLVVQ